MKKKVELGPCRIGCGRRATMPKHIVCDTCYPSLRVWSNVKTPAERADYMGKLMLRQRRLDAVEHREVVIGTSPFQWRAKGERRLAAQSMRRQRSNVR